MGRGWYILVALIVGLVLLLVGFAAFMTYENGQSNCAPEATNCGSPPGN